jgi:hypothetical protein
MAPAGIEISMIGSISAVCTSATLSADDVICVIAQAAPTPWISSPRLDRRLASQIRRNTECRSGAKILSERFGGSVISGSGWAAMRGDDSCRASQMPAKTLSCPVVRSL